MVYYINGLEYFERNVEKMNVERLVFDRNVVTLGRSNSMPSKGDVLIAARNNPRIRKAWVMKLESNRWSKVMDTLII